MTFTEERSGCVRGGTDPIRRLLSLNVRAGQGMADGTLTLVESNLRTIVLFFNEEPVIPASLPHH